MNPMLKNFAKQNSMGKPHRFPFPTRGVLPGAVAALVVAIAASGPACGSSAPNPAVEPNTASAKSTLAERAPLGTNLFDFLEWGTELPLLDVFKSSSPWRSNTGSIVTDSHGWVRSLAPGQDVWTQMLIGDSHYPTGDYVVTYDGEGAIEYNHAATVESVNSSNGRDVIHVVAPSPSVEGGIFLRITRTNPANYIRNIHVRMPNAPAGEIFNPVFLDRIKNYKTLRFMLWNLGGDQQNNPESMSDGVALAHCIVHWADRPTLDDARFGAGRGVPLELICALANRLKIDPWISINHLADDDFVLHTAQTANALLDPSLKLYIEHSNEVFNPNYIQHDYAVARGRALGLDPSPNPDPHVEAARYNALRSAQIFAIFEKIFPPNRLVRVLGSWFDFPSIAETELSFRETADHTDALAVAPYFMFDVDYVPVEERERVSKLNVAQLLAELDSRILPEMRRLMDENARIARSHKVDLIAYEGGESFGTDKIDNLTPALDALFDGATRSRGMGLFYTKFLENWTDAGGKLFVHFQNCQRVDGQTSQGRFGSLEYITQPREEAPKYDALQRWMERR